MASLVGPPALGLRARWRDMAAVEIPKDRWTSLGVLAFGLAAAGASLGVHLFF